MLCWRSGLDVYSFFKLWNVYKIMKKTGEISMRFLCSLGAAALLSACATVKVQPASMTTSFVQAESELSKSAKSYISDAEAEGWITTTSPLAFFQSKLYGSEEQVSETYASHVAENYRMPVALGEKISSDILKASEGLSKVNDDAAVYLDADTTKSSLVRSDVVAFESTLIAAQKVRKSFSEACKVLRERAPMRAEDVEKTLAVLDDEIEATRRMADAIAVQWRGPAPAVS